MVNIYYARESTDKERFIYSSIKDRGFNEASPVIVLVPDQYTLEAERQAFRFFDVDSVIGFDVYSISRLGHNILSKLGTGDVTFIDKYGRQMLLTRVMSEIKDELVTYSGSSGKPAFIESMNDFISELKQYGKTPEDFRGIVESMRGEDALSHKLLDMQKIYEAYDERIRGKYTDSEDYVDLFVSRISSYDDIKNARVWIYGFDSFAPKSLTVIRALMEHANEVNVVLTFDGSADDSELFSLTGRVMENLERASKEAGAGEAKVAKIEAGNGCSYSGKNARVAHIEHEIYSRRPRKFRGDEGNGVRIVEAANYHNEAETIAARVMSLIRDRGYRYRDIALICNDDKRSEILERVLDEYGLPVFRDKKRDISGSAVSVYIVALLEFAGKGRKTSDLMRALKTGLSPVTMDEVEKLENYAIRYRINHGMWEKPFTRGKADYSDEELEAIEDIRKRVMDDQEKLIQMIKDAGTYAEFLKSFYLFLTEDLKIGEGITSLMEAQQSVGMRDLADETSQVFAMMTGIFDQMNDLIGEEPFDPEEFLQLFKVGLRQVEVGVLPSTPDDLMIGTMQRTRRGPVRATIVAGANDGILPESAGTSGLFQEDELERLSKEGYELCKVESVRREEEKLAIYRNLSAPQDELMLTYSIAGEQGEAERKSEIVDDILNIFGDIKAESDIVNSGDEKELVSGRRSTLRHLSDALSAARKGGERSPLWDAVSGWYSEHDRESAELVSRAAGFDNRPEDIPESMTDVLMSGRNGGDSLSPSRLEQYAKCPFSYFVDYGLKPEERRVFEAGAREVGDVYHHALMSVTSRLTKEGRWETVTGAEIKEMIHDVVKEEQENYRNGVLNYTGTEIYRTSRIEKTLKDSMDILVKHTRAGNVKESMYEAQFGRGCRIKPVEVDVPGGKCYIEGTIDRLDILDNDRVKIIDYKSGKPELDSTLIKNGYRLQLMLYMKAAQEGVRKPAGVFYFHIGDREVDTREEGFSVGDFLEGTGKTEEEKEYDEKKAEKSAMKEARMDGMVVNDMSTLDSIMGNTEKDEPGPIKVEMKADGTYTTRAKEYLFTEDEFEDIQREADEKVREIVQGIKDGKVGIRPMKIKKQSSACTYCELKSICRFDTAFPGCGYNVIK